MQREEGLITEQQVNWPATERLRKDDKYQRFLTWLKDNGTLIDERVSYPTAFGPNEYIGVSCADNIEAFKAIIAIPKKIIIDVQKVKHLPQFSTIFQENPRMFNSKQQTDAAFNTLSLFLIHQHLKGTDSFYWPYFQAGQCKNLLLHWSMADLQQIQNREILEHVQAYKDELDFQFMNFLRILRKYDKMFPQEISNEQYQRMFQWASEFVMTRAFGWSVPSASLIPFADMLNHGESYLDHFLADVEREKIGETEDTVYTYKKKRCDMTIFKKEHLEPTEQQLNWFRMAKPTIRRKYINKYSSQLQQNVKDVEDKAAINIVARSQYLKGARSLRQLHFAQSSCSQDNDTQDDELTDFAYKTERFKIDDKAILKGVRSTPLRVTLKRYWDLHEQTKTKAKKNSQENAASPPSSDDEKRYELSQNSQQSEEIQNSSSQGEEQFAWIPGSKEENVYFVLYTNRPYRKDEQLYNFYGRRSNRFLLLGYNFATLNNKYDSFCFRMVIQPLATSQPPISKMIFTKQITLRQSQNCIITRQIRIKRQRICIELINHCRCLLLPILQPTLDTPLPATIPTSPALQHSTLSLAKDIINHHLSQYTSSVQNDQLIINNRQTPPRLLAHKRILIEHLKLLDTCMRFLDRWNDGRIELEEKDMEDAKRVKEYLFELQRSRLGGEK